MVQEHAPLLRALPSVDALLGDQTLRELVQLHGRELVVRACRETLDQARDDIRQTGTKPEALVQRAQARVRALTSSTLVQVINGTGIVIHTNLGRAPLSTAALAAMAEVGVGYSNLEYDIPSGQRGSRHDHVSALLAELTGAEAAMVVNNNAAALLLALGALAQGHEVVISRAHLVEIGGGFR
nr:L-seryl-tRNA(Sec) selenium transferase [Ardenticatenales bacterium]